MADPVHALAVKLRPHLSPRLRHPLGRVYRATRHGAFLARRRTEESAAGLWRRSLWRTTVVAVIGSLGKTTTRELLHAVLSEAGPSVRTAKNANSGPGPRRLLLSARPWHRYCVIELGIGAPGDMKRLGRVVRPDVVVLLNVARCHLNTFRDKAAVLEEKARILDHMPTGGLVVTNDACPEIAALVLPSHLRRVRFGGWPAIPEPDARRGSSSACPERHEPLACRLLAARSRWPERLILEVEHTGVDSGGRPEVHHSRYVTRLVGEHWANAVLAAATTARALGIGSRTITTALERVPNWERRLEPVTLVERRATYVRDDFNGSIDTYASSLAWLAQARAERRVVVHGNASDMPRAGGNRRRAKALVERTAAHAEQLVAITPYPDVVRRAASRAGLDPDRVTTLSTVHEAIDWCRAGIREGDLVLCKGRGEQKLERVFLGLFAEVACRREECRRRQGCDGCPELGFEVTPAMRAGEAPMLGPTGDAHGRAPRPSTPRTMEHG